MPIEAEAPADLVTVLCRISDTYGRSICREPQRLAAMLLDICPDRRRESFLLVSALKEQVVSDLLSGLDTLPDEILITRGIRKLRDNLGFAEDSARWAVESWLPACRVLAVTPDRPMRPPSAGAEVPASEAEPAKTPPPPPLDWRWLALCGAAVLCAGVALVTVARFAFFHFWTSFQGWATETAVLCAPLAAAAMGLSAIASALRKRPAPNHRLLHPDRAAFAMTAEVVVLLVLPAVPVAASAMWAYEWITGTHVVGQTHDLTFHLGRLLQSLLLALFFYRWLPAMTAIQGRIASSMLRRR